MKRNILAAAAAGALALLIWGNTGAAGEQSGGKMVVTADSGRVKAHHRYYRKRRPLQVTIYGRRRPGGYSYPPAAVFTTYSGYGHPPPPYAHVRQTPSGPFDSGFYFSSPVSDIGVGSHGGDSPYLH